MSSIENDEHVKRSVKWLRRVQSKHDGGWGMYELTPSRITTTAEAVTALAIAGVNDSVLARGAEFLAQRGQDPAFCKYTRHHAWLVYALVRSGYSDRIPDRCIKALKNSHVQGGWGHGLRSEPEVFPTFLAWRALDAYSARSTGQRRQEDSARSGTSGVQQQSYDWFSRKETNGYWLLADGKAPSFSATSYAVIALASHPRWKDLYGPQVSKAVEFLRSGAKQGWLVEHEENVAGDLEFAFHHCKLALVLMALLAAEQSVFDPYVRKAMMSLYHNLFSDNSGGWAAEPTPTEEHPRPNVFGTSHAIMALETFQRSLSISAYMGHQKMLDNEPAIGTEVFVAHGRDRATLLEIKAFLARIKCPNIILEEQVHTGAITIFEKFLQYASGVGYAIVLFTPDDVVLGGSGQAASRARQNVILELGYFIAKLGPERVCLMKKGSIEFPSDVKGVLYLNLDEANWQMELAAKLKYAGIPIDLA
jgi:hypothetical protein